MSSLVIFLQKDHCSQLQVMDGIAVRLAPERFGRRPLKSFIKKKKKRTGNILASYHVLDDVLRI